MKDKMVLNRFKCFRQRQFEKMHSEKTVKQKRKLFQLENRNSHKSYSMIMKIYVLKSFTKFTGRAAALLKKNTDTGIFQFCDLTTQEHLFYITPLDNCFC